MISIKNISLIKLKGFQSHTDTEIKLSPGLNVVTGASDSGKTAVIRSIRWALYSEPQGEAFINPDVGKAQVSLVFSDDAQITKTRGKGENSYSVNGADFKGFGTNIPVEINLAHGMPKATFGEIETSLNISFQLDAPFLLSETPGAAAKVLGKLAGTEELDLAAKDVNGDLFKARQEKNQLEGLIEKTEMALKDYEWVADAELKLKGLQTLIGQLKEKKERDLHLVKLADKIVDLNIEREKVTDKIAKFQNLILGQNKIAELERVTANYSNMISMQRSCKRIAEQAIDNMIIIKALKKLPKAIELQQEADKITSKLPQMRNLEVRFEGNNKSSWLQKSVLNKMKNLDVGISMLAKAIDKGMNILPLKDNKTKFEYVSGRIEGGGVYLKKFENLGKVEQILLGTNAKLIQIDKLEDCSNIYSDRSIKIRNTRVDIATNTEFEETSRELFTDYLKELGKCPTCHTDIEDMQIKSIIGGV